MGTALGLLALLSCTPSWPKVTPLPPASVSAPVTSGLRVELTWLGAADLDLYVTDPAFESVYFANTPSRSGGRLESDARCETIEAAEPSSERILWKEPPPGSYRVGVDYIESCDGSTELVAFRVRIEIDGQRQDLTGRVELQRFQPIVAEFVVPASSAEIGNTQAQEVEP